MSILDKKYKLIKLDLVEKTYNNDLNMYFSISDNETSDFYIQITKNLVEIDLSDFQVTLHVLKPDGKTKKMDLTQNEEGLFYCNLTVLFKNKLGTYSCQVFIENEEYERVATRSKFTYEVGDDLIHQENDIEDSTIEIPIKVYNDETDTEEIIIITSTGDNSEIVLEEVEA